VSFRNLLKKQYHSTGFDLKAGADRIPFAVVVAGKYPEHSPRRPALWAKPHMSMRCGLIALLYEICYNGTIVDAHGQLVLISYHDQMWQPIIGRRNDVKSMKSLATSIAEPALDPGSPEDQPS